MLFEDCSLEVLFHRMYQYDNAARNKLSQCNSNTCIGNPPLNKIIHAIYKRIEVDLEIIAFFEDTAYRHRVIIIK